MWEGGSFEHSLKISNILDIAELMKKQGFLRKNIVGRGNSWVKEPQMETFALQREGRMPW